jgi:DNA-binding winged helix-turn-helix (wHTH) protein
MGLSESRDYTPGMMRDQPPAYVSGDLRIRPALGQLMNSAGASVRLGPVNMKVLEALLRRAGAVVGRGELYDTVWRNQAVGEDALTRCISDIRAELRNLSGRDDWIETVPKRGYRWKGEVSEAGFVATDAVPPAPAVPAADVADAGTHEVERSVWRLAGRGLAYLAALAVMASVLVWLIDRFSGPSAPVVAVLPVSAAAVQSEVAAELDLELTQYFMALPSIRVLSRTAIEARPSNPFPFFYYEFGARWLVESELRDVSGHRLLTISIADARTGIVELQVTEEIPVSGAGGVPDRALGSLSRFIESGLAH